MKIIDKLEQPPSFKEDSVVRVKKCASYVKMIESEHYSSEAKVKRIGNGQMQNLRTGQVMDMKEHPDRSPNSTARNRLKTLIIGNCIPECSVFSTLTYATEQKYNKEAVSDHIRFIRRVRNGLKETIEYISVVEQQKRGSIHYHDLLLFQNPIPSQRLNTIQGLVQDSWGHGSTDAKIVTDVNNVANYLIKDYYNPEAIKQFPKNKRKYSTSRGITRITESCLSGKEANELKATTKMISEDCYAISDDETGFFDVVSIYSGSTT